MPYTGGRRVAAQLKYPAHWYVPDQTVYNKLTEKQVQAEYSRLRSIARKRIERLEKSDPQSAMLKYKGQFPRVDEIGSKAKMAKALSNVSRFVSDPRSSLKQSRAIDRENVKLLRRHGFDVNMSNIREFADFMEFYRAKEKGKRNRGSDEVAALWTEAQRLDVDTETIKKDYKYYKKNVEALQNLEPEDIGTGREGKITSYLLKKAIRAFNRGDL